MAFATSAEHGMGKKAPPRQKCRGGALFVNETFREGQGP
ncbi:hypothetical protein PDR5_48650 [Pseudomonas sp. DR 5-09]|nr:hypothetical protein PDR5_48650 [Pseudomonas sp. DR 5-09]